MGYDINNMLYGNNSNSKKREPLTSTIRNEVLSKQKQRCGRCRHTFGSVKHFHHKNGDRSDNRVSNIVALCPTCHSEIHHEKRLKEQKNGKKKGRATSGQYWVNPMTGRKEKLGPWGT